MKIKKIIKNSIIFLLIITLISSNVISNSPIEEKTNIINYSKNSLNDPWWNTNWKNRIEIIIDSNKIEEKLNNFPILIKLDSNNFNFNKTQFNGEDIRFLNKTNQIIYDYEIGISQKDETRNVSYGVNIRGLEQLRQLKEGIITLYHRYQEDKWLDEKIKSEGEKYVEYNGNKICRKTKEQYL